MINGSVMPIETKYRGYRFRSRLEARWAVFFDALNIQWGYEKEGFDIGGTRYLPDFWLPHFSCWAEVKGGQIDEEGRQKIESMAFRGTAPVLLLKDIFEPYRPGDYADFYCLDLTTNGSGGACVMNNVSFAFCHNCGALVLDFGDWDTRYDEGRRSLLNPDWTPWSNPCHCDPPKNQLSTFIETFGAAETARSARFEYGQCG